MSGLVFLLVITRLDSRVHTRRLSSQDDVWQQGRVTTQRSVLNASYYFMHIPKTGRGNPNDIILYSNRADFSSVFLI